jgi:hypothetical protein
MFQWLADHVIPLSVLLILVAAAGFAHWWLSRKRNVLYGAGVAVFLMVVLWILSIFVVTDRQMIVTTIKEMEQAIKERKVDKFFEHVSKSFRHNGMDKDGFRLYVKGQFDRYKQKMDTFQISGVNVENVSRTDGAKVVFHIHFEGLVVRCEAEFVFENERWLLKGFELFFPAHTLNPLKLPQP